MRRFIVTLSMLALGAVVGCGAKDTKDSAPTPPPSNVQGTGTPVITPPVAPPVEKKNPPVENKKSLRIEIANAKLIIDGKTISVPCESAELEKALGKPSGIADDPTLPNVYQYVYWSDLGIRVCRGKNGKQLVCEFDFFLLGAYDLSTKGQTKPFTGELLLEGQMVTTKTKPAELKEKVKSLSESPGGGWKLTYDTSPVHVFVSALDTVNSVRVEQPFAAR